MRPGMPGCLVSLEIPSFCTCAYVSSMAAVAAKWRTYKPMRPAQIRGCINCPSTGGYDMHAM
jgi:hypothetical protein